MADNRSGLFAKARERRIYATTETTFGTHVKPSATDAISMRSGGISSPQPNRVERDDNRPSRSLEEHVNGGFPPVAWSYEGFLIPSGTAGTPPDIHPLLLAALGTDTYTNTPATSDAYLLTDTAQNRGSVSLHEFYPAGGAAAKDGVFSESLFGAIVSTLKISGSSGEPPTIELSGVGSQYALTGRDDVNDAAPGSSATVTVTDVSQFRVGSIIMFLEEADGTTLVSDASGAGHRITAINGSVITLDVNTDAGVADNDIIAPWAPTQTRAGSPIPGILGSLTVGGVGVSPLAYEFEIDNGDVPHDNEAFREWAMSGYHEDKRRVTGQFTFRAKASDMKVLLARGDFPATTITLVIGSTAGNICTVTLETEIQFADIEKASEDTAICVAPFKGLASSSGSKDELAIVFT